MSDVVLSISHLTKRFDQQTILEDLSLDVREGEVVVIVGSSGCGKSTLLRCINALEEIQGGEIRLRGEPIRHNSKNLPEMRRKIGMVFQNYELFPHLTVLDNIIRQLSGGQKQRVAIVRALIMHPEILLFDEVTAALDPEMVREVLDVIVSLADQGKTMLIVTHEMSFARAVADRIILLEDRRILEENTPEQFFTSPKTEQAEKFLQSFEFNRKKKAEA